MWVHVTQEAEEYEHLLFCVGEVQQVFDVNKRMPFVVKTYKNERSMLMAFQHMIVNHFDPDFVVTYESEVMVLLVKRLEALNLPLHRALGRIRGQTNQSSRNGKTKLELPGRVVINLDKYILDTKVKLRNHTLEALAQHFLATDEVRLGEDDVAALCSGEMADRSQIVYFMSRHSQLPLQIMSKLQTVVNLVEMARVTGVLITWLLETGDQYKALSQLSRACKEQGFLIAASNFPYQGGGEKGEGTKVKGATVLDPQIGAHVSPICTLDFASLYPSIMIAYNVSYETLVRGDGDPRHHPDFANRSMALADMPCKRFDESGLVDMSTAEPNQHCNEPKQHSNTFWQRGAFGIQEGIVPSILRRLLQARKHTKMLLKKETDPNMKQILDQRQLAYKVSCNAIYGNTSSMNGKHALPCKDLASTTTAVGRQLIEHTKCSIEDTFSVANGYHADASVIYGLCLCPSVIYDLLCLCHLWSLHLQHTQQFQAYAYAHIDWGCELY